jgi:hypothetical protein
MNYETAQTLSDVRFKRLVGVKRETFFAMIEVLKKEYQLVHHHGGRTPKLSLENLLLATFQYLREYRTYEVIALEFGVNESNLIRRSHWVEETLLRNGFSIEKYEQQDGVSILDATEIWIERPKKNK